MTYIKLSATFFKLNIEFELNEISTIRVYMNDIFF